MKRSRATFASTDAPAIAALLRVAADDGALLDAELGHAEAVDEADARPAAPRE